MRLLTAAAIYLTSLATTKASYLFVNNYCPMSLYVSDANQTNWTPPTIEIKSGVSYASSILGEGNQLGVSIDKDYYNEDTPRFILGSTLKDNTVWWTVNKIGGDPFDGEPFNVTSTDDACGHTNTYNLDTHNCPDGDFALSFNPCVDFT